MLWNLTRYELWQEDSGGKMSQSCREDNKEQFMTEYVADFGNLTKNKTQLSQDFRCK